MAANGSRNQKQKASSSVADSLAKSAKDLERETLDMHAQAKRLLRGKAPRLGGPAHRKPDSDEK